MMNELIAPELLPIGMRICLHMHTSVSVACEAFSSITLLNGPVVANHHYHTSAAILLQA